MIRVGHVIDILQTLPDESAQCHGRAFIGIELSEKYAEMARERLAAVTSGVAVKERRNGQKGLWD